MLHARIMDLLCPHSELAEVMHDIVGTHRSISPGRQARLTSLRTVLVQTRTAMVTKVAGGGGAVAAGGGVLSTAVARSEVGVGVGTVTASGASACALTGDDSAAGRLGVGIGVMPGDWPNAGGVLGNCVMTAAGSGPDRAGNPCVSGKGAMPLKGPAAPIVLGPAAAAGACLEVTLVVGAGVGALGASAGMLLVGSRAMKEPPGETLGARSGPPGDAVLSAAGT